jgi:hypothetical protein
MFFVTAKTFDLATGMQFWKDLGVVLEGPAFKTLEEGSKLAIVVSSAVNGLKRLSDMCDAKGMEWLTSLASSMQNMNNTESDKFLEKEMAKHPAMTPAVDRASKSLRSLGFLHDLAKRLLEPKAESLAKEVANIARAHSLDLDFLVKVVPMAKELVSAYMDSVETCAEVVVAEFESVLADFKLPVERCRPVLAAAADWQLGSFSSFFDEQHPDHASVDRDTKVMLELRSSLSATMKCIDKVMSVKEGPEGFMASLATVAPLIADYKAPVEVLVLALVVVVVVVVIVVVV